MEKGGNYLYLIEKGEAAKGGGEGEGEADKGGEEGEGVVKGGHREDKCQGWAICRHRRGLG